MTKGMYQFIRDAWKKPDKIAMRERTIDWRASESIVKVDHPLRLDKARALGYKAKNGFLIVRIRIERGGRRRPRPRKGRQGKKLTVRKVLSMSYRLVAEQRVARKFQNLAVLNSYEIGKDGQHYFYEVILVDPSVPEIQSDKNLKWLFVKNNQKKVFRGLTSAGRKSRGLRGKE